MIVVKLGCDRSRDVAMPADFVGRIRRAQSTELGFVCHLLTTRSAMLRGTQTNQLIDQ